MLKRFGGIVFGLACAVSGVVVVHFAFEVDWCRWTFSPTSQWPAGG